MFADNRNTTGYPKLVEDTIKALKKKGYKIFQAFHPDYEPPAEIKSTSQENGYTPDIKAKKNEGDAPSYVDIAEKVSKDQLQRLVTKWELLSTIAKIKHGQFFIVTPSGTITLTKDLLEKYQRITAETIRV